MNVFEKCNRKYPNQFSENNFKYKKCFLASTKYLISVRDLRDQRSGMNF